jgi:hypothetical protein
MVARAGTPDFEFAPLVTPYEKLTASNLDSATLWQVSALTHFSHTFNGKPKASASRQRADAFGLPLNKYLQQVVTYAGHKVALSN